MLKVAISLEQSKSMGIVVDQVVHARARHHLQRTPEPLPSPIVYEHAIRIVHLRMQCIVHTLPTVLTEEIHACHVRDSEFSNSLAKKQSLLHVHFRLVARMQREVIGTRHARPIHQRVDIHIRSRYAIGLDQPKLREIRKLFRSVSATDIDSRINAQAPIRETVRFAFRHKPKISSS